MSSRNAESHGNTATLYSIGGLLDSLSKLAHLVHLELASNSVLETVIAWRSLPTMSRHGIISSTSTATMGTKTKGKFLNGKRLVFPSLSPPRLPIDARRREKPE